MSDIRIMLDVAARVAYEGEPLTPEDLEIETSDIAGALDLYGEAQRQAAAARAVVKATGTQLARLLGVGGAAGYGDSILRYKVGRKERCHDPAGVIAYLTDEISAGRVDLSDVVNPRYVKKAWMTPASRDTFYEWVDDDEPSLSMVPRSKAPKWLQDLGDGEVIVKEDNE